MTDGQFRYWGRLDPDPLTGNVNNYAPPGCGESTLIYLTADGNYSITGFKGEPYTDAGNAANRMVRFYNNTTNRTFSFPGNDSGSDAENRFAQSTTITISRGECAEFTYDRGGLLWRFTGIVATAPSAAGSDTQVTYNDGGSAAGDADHTWDKTNNQLTVTHARIAGVLSMSGDISVTLSSSPGNGWAPSGHATAGVVRINPDTVAVDILGFPAPVSPYADGRLVLFLNVGTGGFPATLVNQSGTETTAANRFILGATLSIRQDRGALMRYDTTSSRWGCVATCAVFDDSSPVAVGSSDPTKGVRLECDTNVPTGTIVALAVPASNGTIATLALAETLTNKTLTTPTISSFANANHSHADSAGGGTLNASAIAAGTMATARLGSGTADDTSFLRGDSTWVAAVEVLAREVTLINIVSSAAETDIFNQTVAANRMETNRMLRLTIVGDFLNNSGSTSSPTIKVKVGGTTIYDDATAALASGANRFPVRMTFEFGMQNANNTMHLSGVVGIGNAGGATTGIGNLATDESNVDAEISSGGTFTQATTSSFAVQVTWTNSASDANISFRRQYAVLELV
jgi:hypothetical protein